MFLSVCRAASFYGGFEYVINGPLRGVRVVPPLRCQNGEKCFRISYDFVLPNFALFGNLVLITLSSQFAQMVNRRVPNLVAEVRAPAKVFFLF